MDAKLPIKDQLYLPLKARRYLQSLPFRASVPWTKLYSKADQQGMML